MKTQYSIVAQNDQEVEVIIYGRIGRWDNNSARLLSNEIKLLDTKYQKIIFRLHSEGGEVFEGTAIFTAIRNCQAKTMAIVDGIACSMAAILVMACDEVWMHKTTYLMIHAASGGAYGNANMLRQVIELLDKVDKTLSEILQAKTGKSPEEVAKWMEKDTWFTAQEALDAKLITGIIDSKKDFKLPKLPKNQKELNTQELYNLFAETLLPEEPGNEQEQEETTPVKEETTPVNQNSNHKNDSMKLTNEQIQEMGLSGVTASSSEADVLAAIQTKQKADQDKISKLQNDLKAADAAKKDALLDNAESQGKITAKQREWYDKVSATSNYEDLKALLDEIPARTKITDLLKGSSTGGSTPENRDTWTWDDYQEKDPQALEKLEAENNAEFRKLLNAKYKPGK